MGSTRSPLHAPLPERQGARRIYPTPSTGSPTPQYRDLLTTLGIMSVTTFHRGPLLPVYITSGLTSNSSFPFSTFKAPGRRCRRRHVGAHALIASLLSMFFAIRMPCWALRSAGGVRGDGNWASPSKTNSQRFFFFFWTNKSKNRPQRHVQQSAIIT